MKWQQLLYKYFFRKWKYKTAEKKVPKHKKNSTLLIETKYGVLNHLQFKILFFIHTNNQLQTLILQFE